MTMLDNLDFSQLWCVEWNDMYFLD